ncbi:MAG: hypothetical protein PHY14_04160 [Candidatus Gracilibacteria bacterium]|nr:hypothetical protein [Candidatus Gracilibacteria bacterium]
MQSTENFYISDEVFLQAQEEGANYIRALDALMNDMRSIGPNSKIDKHLLRFYHIYAKLYPRVMLVLAGFTDFDDEENAKNFMDYRDSFLVDIRKLLKMVALIRSTKWSAHILAAYKGKEWCQDVYTMADDIFADWKIGEANRLCFAPDD